MDKNSQGANTPDITNTNKQPKPQNSNAAILSHVPSFNIKKATGRPQTARSMSAEIPDINFCSNLFTETCSKYKKVQNVVNIKKQAPRREIVNLGLAVEYTPKYDIVFPHSKSGIAQIK